MWVRLVLGVGAVLFVSFLWYRGDHYQKAAARLEVQLDAALEIVDANAAAYDTERAAAATAAADKRAIRAASDVVRREIIAAPASDDGPLAPVLRRQLDRMPAASAGDAGSADRTAGRTGGVDAAAAAPGTGRDAARRSAVD